MFLALHVFIDTSTPIKLVLPRYYLVLCGDLGMSKLFVPRYSPTAL